MLLYHLALLILILSTGSFAQGYDEQIAIESVDDLFVLIAGEELDDAGLMTILDTKGLLSGESACKISGMDTTSLLRLLDKGYISTVRKFLEACSEDGLKFEDSEIQKSINKLKKSLGELSLFLQTSKHDRSLVVPAFEWAQSRDSIFISVKFAHKLDTPACIDVVDDKAEMESQRVIVRAECKGKRKQFLLDLQLLKEIVPANSTWAMASVGRGMLTLKKKVEKKWARLLKSRERVKNMHKWFSLQEKYDDELQALEKEEAEARLVSEKGDDANNNSISNVTKSNLSEVEKQNKSVSESSKDPHRALEVEKEIQRKSIRKKAKLDKKRLKKQKTKAIKQIDEELDARKRELDKEATEKKQKLQEKYDKDISTLDESLDKALNEIEAITDESQAQTIFQRITSFFVSNSKADGSIEDRIESDREL